MNRSFLNDDPLDSIEELGLVARLKNISRTRKKTRGKAQHVAPTVSPVEAGVAETHDEKFQITYKAARHEAGWLEESLADFFDQKLFDDVLRMVKGGKEASVYLCTGNANTGLDYLAAKVYRPQRFRNLKNDWVYKEGRASLDASGNRIRNEGMLHAIKKRTGYGRELMHTSWLEHEYLTLKLLHEAGADVPKPIISGENAILMEYFGDEVVSAPTLNDIRLPAHEARDIFDRVVYNIDLMLSLNRIHGDLSAYNILYWDGAIVLIDFPQVVQPDDNSSAYPIFTRDVTRVCEYFQQQGVRANPRQLASDLWEKHSHRSGPALDPKILGEDRDDERDIWESLKNG